LPPCLTRRTTVASHSNASSQLIEAPLALPELVTGARKTLQGSCFLKAQPGLRINPGRQGLPGALSPRMGDIGPDRHRLACLDLTRVLALARFGLSRGRFRGPLAGWKRSVPAAGFHRARLSIGVRYGRTPLHRVGSVGKDGSLAGLIHSAGVWRGFKDRRTLLRLPVVELILSSLPMIITHRRLHRKGAVAAPCDGRAAAMPPLHYPS